MDRSAGKRDLLFQTPVNLVEMWKRVTLTSKVFDALASEERIAILKLLDQRQMTGTDIANKLGRSKSSIFKQLQKLQEADLVKRVDEGRKWIYYYPTDKAKRILHPEDVVISLL